MLDFRDLGPHCPLIHHGSKERTEYGVQERFIHVEINLTTDIFASHTLATQASLKLQLSHKATKCGGCFH